MVTTQKAESESEEIWDKVRTRATVTTDLGDRTAELGQQTVKLIASLTHAGQGNSPCSVPSSPWERGWRGGCNSGGIPIHPNSCNGRGGPCQMTLAHSLTNWHGVGSTGKGCNGQGNQGPSARRYGTANCWDPNSL